MKRPPDIVEGEPWELLLDYTEENVMLTSTPVSEKTCRHCGTGLSRTEEVDGQCIKCTNLRGMGLSAYIQSVIVDVNCSGKKQ